MRFGQSLVLLLLLAIGVTAPASARVSKEPLPKPYESVPEAQKPLVDKFLGELSPLYWFGRDVLEQAVTRGGVKVSQLRSLANQHGIKDLTVEETLGGMNFMIGEREVTVSPDTLGIYIYGKYRKPLVSHDRFGFKRIYLTYDDRPLKTEFYINGEVRTIEYNVAPRSIREIYGKLAPYNGKSLKELEKISRDKRRVGVAVIDTGAYYDDPEIAYKFDRKAIGYDLVENDETPAPRSGGDMFSEMFTARPHGAMTAPLAVEGSDKLRLIVVRFKAEHQIDAGIKYAVDAAKARVVSMSIEPRHLFGKTNGVYLCQLIEERPTALFVIAAGNGGKSLEGSDEIVRFCDAPNLLLVGSAAVLPPGNEMFKPEYSNFSAKLVRISANGMTSFFDGNLGTRVTVQGTSFATPRVAAAAGKVFAINRRFTPKQVIDILLEGASRHKELEEYFENGRFLNEKASLKLARKRAKR